MVIFLLALIGAVAVMIVLAIGRLAFGRREKFDRRKFFPWLLRYFIFNYLFCLLILYLSLPALTGPFWGWQWLVWPLIISCIANLFAFARPAVGMLEDVSAAAQSGRFRTVGGSEQSMPRDFSRGAVAAAIFGLIIAGLVGIVAPLLITIFSTWFDINAKALAAIPNVRIQKSAVLPPTDANHIVLVSKGVAAYKGQQVLGSNGQNLGSAYGLDPDSYTLQSIKGHLYYVAPLSYNNIFVNLSNPTTPGFVVVDAENPQAVPQLRTEDTQAGTSLRFLPGALLNQDLLRHVYLSGYTNGRLLDPTLEVDDNYHPYWTVSLMQPIRGYVGDVLSDVLIVDAHTGVITKYAPQGVPKWVDRVMPASTVSQYLQWWGLYHAAPWFNPSGLGQETPASDPELLYNRVDQPVWLIPMTSSSSNNNSSTGVFLFNTYKNEADFYPLAGIGIGDNVVSTFKSTRSNIRNYDVSSVQLYQIYNTPTWVAIYVQSTGSPSDSGSRTSETVSGIFQAVGLVDARNLNGSNVQFDTSLTQALQDYQQWLTQQGTGGGVTSGGQQTVTGKVLRISSVQQGGSTVYYLQIEGQKNIFTANLSLSPKLPLVQSGDTVTGTFQTSSNSVVNFQSFDDTSINLGGTTPVPSGTPTPGATPAITPTATTKPKP
ncbi:hypothetical protein KSF_020980 [Reticulibacter mediterranei]|uniref:Uncharacterized protein n=1 Tax=Reticulibacter mediterranei TaxID=2778369 RepID=A0A8J3N192_9CHLR|nr:hypothetical protein [Reticulibacter mediterranei]GHO92050.1 hypothetical protein KSF_020980 [Reticulibacter mediterranei]